MKKKKKWRVCFLKNATACLAGGKGQEWEKCVCMVHGKFLHCLRLQSHSKTASVVPAKERWRVISLSHYWRGGDTQKVLRRGEEMALSRGSIHINLDWWGKKKNHNVLLKKKIKKNQRLPFLIGLCWLLSRGNLESRRNSDEFKGLTFAGVGGRFRTAGVSEEARLAVVAVAALRVVAAVVAHAAAAPSRREPQPSTEVAALGVTVALALWVEQQQQSW